MIATLGTGKMTWPTWSIVLGIGFAAAVLLYVLGVAFGWFRGAGITPASKRNIAATNDSSEHEPHGSHGSDGSPKKECHCGRDQISQSPSDVKMMLDDYLSTRAAGGTGTGPKTFTVLYHMDVCGGCKAFFPMLQKAIGELNGQVYLTGVEYCHAKEGTKLMNDENHVDGFPTVVAYSNTGKKVPYKGELSYQEIKKFLLSTINA